MSLEGVAGYVGVGCLRCCVVLCCMLVLGVLGVGKRDGGCP